MLQLIGPIQPFASIGQKRCLMINFSIYDFSGSFKRAKGQATEPRVKREVRSVLVNSPVATFKQSENVAIAHLHVVRAAACSEGCGATIGSSPCHFLLRMCTVLMGNLDTVCVQTTSLYSIC